MSEEKQAIIISVSKDGKLLIECRNVEILEFLKILKKTKEEIEKLNLD